MKEMKTTAQVLVDCLEAEGVDVMFGIPGEETLDLMFAIRDSKIRFIPVRHEQGAAFMADVYGRLTGRAGVCLSTLGPGATNLVTGVADAYLDGAPLVAITGQVGTDRMQLTSHQYQAFQTDHPPGHGRRDRPAGVQARRERQAGCHPHRPAPEHCQDARRRSAPQAPAGA